MRRIAYFVLLCLLGCEERGFVDQPCNNNGTCNDDKLICMVIQHRGHFCMLKTDNLEFIKSTVGEDSIRFCNYCLQHCNVHGVKICAYSDTSVWGSKPSVCECR